MQNFNVDISAPGGPLVFYAMQADSLSRFFTLTISDNGATWNPPPGALWSVRFGAPQMPSGWYDTIEDATDATHPAVNVATGVATVATVEIAEQALSTPGQNILCVLVTDSSGYQIASWPIILSIQAVPGLTAPEVTTYYNLLTGQVAQTLQNAQAAAASATLAESWAVGGTGTREGEDTNNSEYWAQQSQAAANNRVASFNGRTGAVVPESGDYTATMVGALGVDDTANSASGVAVFRVTEDVDVTPQKSFLLVKEFTTNSQNLPTANYYQVITMAGSDISAGTQLAIGESVKKLFYRIRSQSVWSSWYEIFTTQSLPSAIKLSPPINIGSASFDGSADITLAEMGAQRAIKSHVYKFSAESISGGGTKAFSVSFAGAGLPSGSQVLLFQTVNSGWAGIIAQGYAVNNEGDGLLTLTLYNVADATRSIGPQIYILYF